MSGSRGLIGSAMCDSFRDEDIFRLVRSEPKQNEILWNPDAGKLDASALEGFDAIINLSGEPVVGSWTEKKKSLIRDSRVKSTELLADTISKLENPPAVFLCASAVGYYGNRGNEILTEESSPGKGFLPDVSLEWEKAAAQAQSPTTRVASMRFGIVLSKKGGALKKMLSPFSLGLGAKLGNGRQYMSWISLQDLVSAAQFCLRSDSTRGPVNFCSPNPVTNAEFTRTLAKVIRRPALLSIPGFVLKLALGEIAEGGLLASQRAIPKKLLESGFTFAHADLEKALRAALEIV